MKKCCIQKATLWAESVASMAQQSPRLFGKVPANATLDFSVRSDAFRLYVILAVKNYKTNFRTNLVDVSVRGLAVLLNRHPSTISRWLKNLVVAGHLEKLTRRGQRAVYRLTSPVFTYRAIVETAPNQVAEVSSEQLPEVRGKRAKCPRCGHRARISSTAGVCDGCLRAWTERMAG